MKLNVGFKPLPALSLSILNEALYVATYFALAAGKKYGSNRETVRQLGI